MAEVTSILDDAGIDYEILEHAHTERAADEATALGIAPEEVAKTLVLSTPGGSVRAVLPGSARIDLHKVGELVGTSGKKVQLASEDDLRRDYADFELGAVPPFGGRSDRVILDRALAERESLVLEAGSHERSVRMNVADLIRLTGADVVDITREER